MNQEAVDSGAQDPRGDSEGGADEKLASEELSGEALRALVDGTATDGPVAPDGTYSASSIKVLEGHPEDEAKLEYIYELGPETSACVGNGRNDRLMLKACRLGVAVLGEEGAAVETVSAADIVVPGIVQALELFTRPLRLKAALRT